MIERALSDADTQALITYARQKFAEECYPLSPALRPVREALAKIDPRPKPLAAPEALRAEHPGKAQDAALTPNLPSSPLTA